MNERIIVVTECKHCPWRNKLWMGDSVETIDTTQFTFDGFMCRKVKKHTPENGEGIPEWCPLRPLPEKQQMRNSEWDSDKWTAAGNRWVMGWNACLKEIEGDEDE